MHRKTRAIPRFQVGHMVTAALLAVITVTLAVAAILIGQAPAAASGIPARVFQPAVTAASAIRPAGNGYAPKCLPTLPGIDRWNAIF